MSTDLELQKPLVSIIIVTYNRPLYLKVAIESAIQQKYRNIEILVSDDCSPESPQDLIDSFQDSRICFHRNPTNLGMFHNTLNTFKRASGKYVASLNDDDLWHSDFLAKLVPHLEGNPDLTMAFCDQYIVDSKGVIDYPASEENTRRWKRDHLKEGIYEPFCELALVNQSASPASAAVIRKDAIEWESIPLEADAMYDLYVAYLACRSGRGAYYYPERLTLYRVHEQSYTAGGGTRAVQSKIRKGNAGVFCFGLFMADERLQEFRPYFRHKWVRAKTSLAIASLQLGKTAEARSYLLSALNQKFNLRTLSILLLSITPGPLIRRVLGVTGSESSPAT